MVTTLPLIPPFERQRDRQISKSKASLIYNASFRTVGAVTQRNPQSQNQNPKSNQKDKTKRKLKQPTKQTNKADLVNEDCISM